VQIIGTSQSIFLTALTDAQGKFLDTLETSSNVSLIILSSKAGFGQDTVTAFITSGADYAVPVIRMIPIGGTTTKVSGNPISIYLFSQSTTSIGVRGSGSVETATITFVAVDSSGTPIDLNHSVNVAFSFGEEPNGGEILTPPSTATNDSGLASVNITSGTKAGTVQIYAQIVLGAKKIYSLPIAIAIFGGLPDILHFSVAPAQLNFPGYDIYGLKDLISAYVGDKYSNPARPGTAVYFSSTGGIIGGSANTDVTGVGSVQLMSAAPRPQHPLLGAGFATVYASTGDENKNMISDSTIVLFSGITIIQDISPTSFDIPNGGQQTFTYTVCDENGNPLAGGTQIQILVAGTDAGVQGDVQVVLPDTQSKTWTHFSFVLYDTNDTTNAQTPCTLTFVAQGPNGKDSRSISGIKY
jgi:hypothetical protein